MKQVSQAQALRVGIVGLGTVGAGTFNILNRNFEKIEERCSRQILVTHIGTRRDNPNVDLAASRFASAKISRDIFDVVNDADIDVLVELIGGTDTAYQVVKQALEAGKHVVTANKALIAVYGNELVELAKQKHCVLAFEAAVAGGIPIIKALTEGLAGNEINWLAGIINGTGNFILTEMREKGRDFSDALKDAQAKGYAEADPTFDVEGIDAAHKLAILAALAFSVPFDFDKIYTEGITKITAQDLRFAQNFGYQIKHLGIAKKNQHGIEVRVHPTLVQNKNLLAKVDGVMNAVMINGNAVGNTLYYGAGAGAEPTGSAVCADIVDIACGCLASKQVAFTRSATYLAIEDIRSAYYLRVQAKDQPGVLAKISRVLSEYNISIEGIYQQEVQEGETSVPVVIISQKVREAEMNEAIKQMLELDCTEEDIIKIRIEHFKN